MKKIALVHPELGLGGPDTVAAWIADTLRYEFLVDFILCKEPDLKKINSLYGTSLNKENIKVKVVNMPSFIKNSAKGRLLKQHFLMRYCKKNAAQYDLMFSTYNEMDFGRKGIQYIHFPSMDIGQNAKYNLMIDKWYYKDSIIRKIYLLLGKFISGYDLLGVLNNLTLVNSDWTGKIVNSIYGCRTMTLYPSVPDDFFNVDWESRKNDFVYVGIISPDKKIAEIISILGKVRKSGFDITLRLIGRIRGEGSNYDIEFRKLLEKNKDWIIYEGAVSRNKMLEIIAQCKYGIHAKKEHFGISIAELIKAGCITFVPAEGGHLEIVGSAKEFLGFIDEDDAVRKISAIISDKQLQDKVRAELKINIDKFSIADFKRNLLKIVEQFFTEQANKKG
ncbi:MAG: glycosyltransferase [Candidatus Omnitrophota bacterium]